MVIKYNPVDSTGEEKNGAKYLPKSVFLRCFKKGKLLHVDKTIAGSGMSHSFLNSLPKSGTVNILIAPNRQVVLSKEESYHKNKSNYLSNIQFFCSGSGDSVLHKKTDIVVTTTDTCLKMFDELSMKSKGLVLIDEYHSTIQGSIYRSSLEGFLDKIKRQWLTEDTCITTVSATPLLFANVDITLIPTSYYRRYDLICNDNYKEVIEEAKDYIENSEEHVIIFTNSIKVISQFSTRKNDKSELRADLKVGSKLLESICKRFELVYNPKFIIGSSQAFEGFDIEESNIRVYFFQDLDNDTEEGFNAGNIYQAINRTRNGYNSATYCKAPKKEVLNSIESIVEIVEESSLKNYNYGSYSQLNRLPNLNVEDKFRFLRILQESKTASGVIYKVNEDLLNLEKEKEVMINKGLFATEYRDFIRNRNINLIDTHSIPKTVSLKNTRNAPYYCYINRDVILQNKLNEKAFIFKAPADHYKEGFTLKKLIRSFRSQYQGHLCFVNYMQYYDNNLIFSSETQNLLTKHLNEGTLERFLCDLKRSYGKSKKEELRALRNSPTRLKELKEKIIRYKRTIQLNAIKLIGALTNEEILLSENIVVNRDYNILTKISMNDIVRIASFMNITVKEFDIKSCAPRVIYASAGFELHSDFYGEDKVNKDKVNTLLNLISKDNNRKKTLSRHKSNLKYSLKKAGFRFEVVEFLINNFYDKPKSAVFNYYTYHEAEICRRVNYKLFGGTGLRRHDSLILFDSLFTGEELDSFRYLGQGGWFIQQAKTETTKETIKEKQLTLWN